MDQSDLDEEIMEAIEDDDVAKVTELVALGASPNAVDSFGDPGVCVAIDNDSAAMLNALLAAKASPNAMDRFDEAPLTKAMEKGDLAMVRALLSAGARTDTADRFGESPLIVAIEMDRLDLIEVLVAAGADVNAPDRFGESAISKVLEESGLGGESIALALLASPRLDTQGTNRYGDPILATAIEERALGAIEALLERGADPYAKDGVGQSCHELAEDAGGAVWASFERGLACALARKKAPGALRAPAPPPPLESLAGRVGLARAGLPQASQEGGGPKDDSAPQPAPVAATAEPKAKSRPNLS